MLRPILPKGTDKDHWGVITASVFNVSGHYPSPMTEEGFHVLTRETGFTQNSMILQRDLENEALGSLQFELSYDGEQCSLDHLSVFWAVTGRSNHQV